MLMFKKLNKFFDFSFISLRKNHVKQFIGDVTDLNFSNGLSIANGTVFQAYQPGL